MPPIKNLIGNRYGKLIVLRQAGYIYGKIAWECKCDCGNIVIKNGNGLKSGHINSCGCLQNMSGANRKHGDCQTRLYKIWGGMLDRCRNPHNKGYKNYGERGINVCNEWNDYCVFRKWALDNGYSDDLTIDRIDNNKGYSPENCRWADAYVQNGNKRNNIIIEYNGEKLPIARWARKIGLSEETLRLRILSGKWTLEEALTTPPHGKSYHCQKHWISVYQCDINTGEVIKKWDSITEAALMLHSSTGNIVRAIKNNRTAVGFRWKYAGKEELT